MYQRSKGINFSLGKESIDELRTFVNTRGIIVHGDLGEAISFYTSFAENQAIFPNYIDAFIRKYKIVPGQGYARDFKETGFDYAMSSGHITFRANKMFSVQFGHGKHFIGDGYRSLLLSDNTFNYPYLRIQTNFGKVQYTNLYTEFMDINYFTTHSVDNRDQLGYPKKYMSSHFLSYNVTKRFSLSLYEAVVWRMNRTLASKGFDINYLNPVTMLRPIEFSLNSPDNVLVGVNTKYKLPFSSYLYGQIILDEFSLGELFIGYTVLAIGTSLPEIAASVSLALKGRYETVTGTLIGSNIFNGLCVLAIPGLFMNPKMSLGWSYSEWSPLLFILFMITFIFAYYIFSVSKKERNASILLSSLFLSSYFVSLYFAY